LALATAGLIWPTPVCEYTPGTVVEVVVEVVDVVGSVCTGVVSLGADGRLSESVVEEVGTVVADGVACDVVEHAATMTSRVLQSNVALSEYRRRAPRRRREVAIVSTLDASIAPRVVAWSKPSVRRRSGRLNS
jgi:hypothetical protein